MKNKTYNVRKKKNNRSKKRSGGMGFVADNDLVSLKFTNYDNVLLCGLCGNNTFQKRMATFGKSKTAGVLADMFLGSDANTVLDISIVCYFCNICANAIIVRDPKSTTKGVYDRKIISIAPTQAKAQAPLQAKLQIQ